VGNFDSLPSTMPAPPVVGVCGHVLIRTLMSRMQIETDPAGTKVTLQKQLQKWRSLGQPEPPDGEPATA
jgi:hypothetical protein